MTEAPTFINGLDLSEAFFHEEVEKLMKAEFPSVPYSAALIGNGSEVLGFDTEMSSDHHWGPRVMLFLRDDDYRSNEELIFEMFAHKLPHRFRGYPTGFTKSNEGDHGVRLLNYADEGPIDHRIEIQTIGTFLESHLGFDIARPITVQDWLSFPAQKLLTIGAGRVFHDGIGLQEQRNRFAYYPHEVWLYLLASGWNRVEQEEHLMGRAGSVGDEIGSAIITSRLVRDLMRLCFLMERQYEPYPKWFGTAFSKLACAPNLTPLLREVLHARTWQERESYLVQAYAKVATMHNALALTKPMPTEAQSFFGRPFMVISMGEFSRAIAEAIVDPEVRALTKRRLIGNVDQVSDNTDILSESSWRERLRHLWD